MHFNAASFICYIIVCSYYCIQKMYWFTFRNLRDICLFILSPSPCSSATPHCISLQRFVCFNFRTNKYSYLGLLLPYIKSSLTKVYHVSVLKLIYKQYLITFYFQAMLSAVLVATDLSPRISYEHVFCSSTVFWTEL